MFIRLDIYRLLLVTVWESRVEDNAYIYYIYVENRCVFFSLSIVGFVGTGEGKTRRYNGRAGRRLLNGRQKEKCDIYNGRVETDAY